MERAPAVVGSNSERGALDSLPAARALQRCGVDQEQIVAEARALAREHARQLLNRVCQAAAGLEVRRLRRDLGKQLAKASQTPEDGRRRGITHLVVMMQ
jgi:hypothetical protein